MFHLRLPQLLLGLAAVAIIATGIVFTAQRFKSTPSAKTGNANTFVSTNAANENINAPELTVEEDAMVEGPRGYGLLFPFSNGLTTNNPRPTFVGKVAQTSSRILLATTFEQEQVPEAPGTEERYLRFVPGTLQSVTATLDGEPLTPLHGFAQYPTILCKGYATETACRSARRNVLPPVIFVARPTVDLMDGSHTLVVNGERMTFTVQRSFQLAAQTPPGFNEARPYETFDDTAPCTPGWYYSSSDLPVPLPKYDNQQLWYGLSFPQSEDEKGSINRRRVQVSFAGQQFDLFFPASQVWYGGAHEYYNTREGIAQGIYVPMNHLRYTDGAAATPWSYSTNPDQQYASTNTYVELYPMDISGRLYRGNQLPWTMNSSSGCDG